MEHASLIGSIAGSAAAYYITSRILNSFLKSFVCACAYVLSSSMPDHNPGRCIRFEYVCLWCDDPA